MFMPKDCESPENICKNVCMCIFSEKRYQYFHQNAKKVHNLSSSPQILRITSAGISNCKSFVGHNILKLNRIEKYESLTLVLKVLFLQTGFRCMCECTCVCVYAARWIFFILRSGLKMFESHCSKAWEMAIYNFVTY